MKATRFYVILVILLLVVSLAACKRNVPGGEQATPATGEPVEVLTPAATDVMEQIYLFATQTAMALGGQTGEPGVQGTPGTPNAPEATETVTTQIPDTSTLPDRIADVILKLLAHNPQDRRIMAAKRYAAKIVCLEECAPTT